MKVIIINFIGMCLFLIGIFTSVLLIGIPLAFLGNDLMDYKDK